MGHRDMKTTERYIRAHRLTRRGYYRLRTDDFELVNDPTPRLWLRDLDTIPHHQTSLRLRHSRFQSATISQAGASSTLCN
jgi:hypothetical protein